MDYQEIAAKNEILFQIANRMLYLKYRGKKMEDFFKNRGISKVAIWGCSDLGQRVYDELKNSEIEVVCGIDIEPNCRNLEIETVAPQKENIDIIKKSDAIIITPIFNITEIFDKMKELDIESEVFSIDKILMEM